MFAICLAAQAVSQNTCASVHTHLNATLDSPLTCYCLTPALLLPHPCPATAHPCSAPVLIPKSLLARPFLPAWGLDSCCPQPHNPIPIRWVCVRHHSPSGVCMPSPATRLSTCPHPPPSPTHTFPAHSSLVRCVYATTHRPLHTPTTTAIIRCYCHHLPPPPPTHPHTNRPLPPTLPSRPSSGVSATA